MTETEDTAVIADPGPRVITIERRFALGGALATAVVVAALAVALILEGGDSRGDHPPFGPGGPGHEGVMPGHAEGLPASPEGGFRGGAQAMPMPQGVAPQAPSDVAPSDGSAGRGGSGG